MPEVFSGLNTAMFHYSIIGYTDTINFCNLDQVRKITVRKNRCKNVYSEPKNSDSQKATIL